ncbi:MAG TPA: hypothetical protein VMA30_02545 [Xanthobacteraceae bacterium]|nr:hypothetical protein [Xanthobacteraceae bacterium]
MLLTPETIPLALSGAVLLAVLIFIFLAGLGRRRRAQHMLVLEQIKDYFLGNMSAGQLRQRIRETASYHLLRERELFALVTTAFQRVADSKLSPGAHSEEDERRLLRLLAAVKKELGLTDRYRIEGWRPGRE